MDLEQTITVHNKKEIKIDNLINIISFNDMEFLVKTGSGNIKIIGSKLEMNNISLDSNLLEVSGIIKKIIFDEDIKDKKEKGFLKKLFK